MSRFTLQQLADIIEGCDELEFAMADARKRAAAAERKARRYMRLAICAYWVTVAALVIGLALTVARFV